MKLPSLQLDNRSSGPAFFGSGRIELRDVRIARQQLGDRFTQNPHSVPVNDPHQIGLPQRSGIQKLVDAFAGFLGTLADQIDLANGGRKLGTLIEGNRRLRVCVDTFGITSSTSAAETRIFRYPASTSISPLSKTLRIVAGCRIPLSRTCAPGSSFNGAAAAPAAGGGAIEATCS